MVYVNGESLKQVVSKANVKPGKFYVDARNNKIYIGSNPAGKTVEATAKTEAFDISAKRSTGTAIRGLGFAHYADGGVEVIGTPSVTLENNTFIWNGIYGVLVRKSENATLRGNTFSFNGMNGIRGGWANNVLLENNTISYNNIEHFRKAWAAAGIKVINTNGAVWRNNLIEHNIGNGMWLDESSINATIKNNVIRHNEQIGIMFELSHKANISGNRISNNAAGVMIADSSNAHVVGNTFFRNKQPVIVKDSPRRNRDRAEIAKGADWVTRNNIVRDNRISR